MLIYGASCKPRVQKKYIQPTQRHLYLCCSKRCAHEIKFAALCFTLGLPTGLFFFPPTSFTVKCSCMPRYHGILHLLWCQQGTRGATIWRICWLQAGVCLLHLTMSCASEEQRWFWWEGNSKNLEFIMAQKTPKLNPVCPHWSIQYKIHCWFKPTEPWGRSNAFFASNQDLF